MAMRETADDLEGIGRGNKNLPPKRGADKFNNLFGHVREVAEGFVPDLASFEVSAPQEVGFVDLSFVVPYSSGYVYSSISLGHIA